jgi:hypothetical protein
MRSQGQQNIAQRPPAWPCIRVDLGGGQALDQTRGRPGDYDVPLLRLEHGNQRPFYNTHPEEHHRPPEIARFALSTNCRFDPST